MTRREWIVGAITGSAFAVGGATGVLVDRNATGRSRGLVGADPEPPVPLPNPDLPPQPDKDPPAPNRPSVGPEWGIVEKVTWDVFQQHDNWGGIIRVDLFDGVARRWPAFVHTKLPGSSITWNGASVTPWELAGNLITQRSQVTYWPVGEYRAGAVKAEFTTWP